MLNLKLDTLLGSMLQCYESLGQEILIQRRSSGQGFHQKDLSVRLRISLWTSGGKTTVPWCSDPADYMLAICGNDSLREMSSPGKSGSFFYLAQDDRFITETMKSEVKDASKLLPTCLSVQELPCYTIPWRSLCQTCWRSEGNLIETVNS